MKIYEVKFVADGQDYKEFEKSTPEEAYEAFLKDNDGYLDVPIEVWEGLEKVATFTRHIGHDDYRKPIAQKPESSPIAQKPESSSSTDEQLEKIYKVLNHMRWLMFGVIFLVFILPWLKMSGCFLAR